MPIPRLLRRALCTSVGLALAACGGSDGGGTGPSPDPTATQVTISPSNFELQLGGTVQLQATVRDASGNLVTGQTIIWTSSDNSVATVTGGLVTGIGGGNATITATVEGRAGTAAGSVLPYRVADNAFPIDSTEFRLVSDRTEMDAGTYRFQFIGTGAQPTFEAGDVIVGMQGLGFMRKATSVTVAGTQIAFQTEEALFDDLIAEGQFGFSVDLLDDGGGGGVGDSGATQVPGSGRAQVTYGDLWVRTPAGVSAAGFGINFDGFDVCKFFKENDPSNKCPGVITEFKLPKGSITFTPSFDFGSTKNSNGDFTEFHGIVTGQFDTNVAVSLGATVSTSIKRQATIFEFGRIVYVQVGAIPVIVHAEMEIVATFEASASVKGKLQAGVTTQHSVDVGARWDDQQGWQGVLTGSGSFTPQQPSIDDSTAVASISLDAKITLAPNLNLKFAGIAGPLIGVEPWARASMIASTTACGFDSSGGIDGKVGIALADFLSKALNNPNFSKKANLATMQGAQWACPVGDVDVTTTTSGVNLDTDGYTILIDGQPVGPIASAGQESLGNVRLGDRVVALQGIADNCSVQGSNPDSINVQVSQRVTSAFRVDCRGGANGTGTVGDLEVSTSTSGRAVDADGYQITVDGNSKASGTNDVVTFAALTPGSRTVSISGLSANCVATPSGQSVTVVADSTTQIGFSVQCAGGDISVSTTTSGAPPTTSTLSLSIGGQNQGSIDFNDQKTFGVITGRHDVTLSSIPTGCALISGASVQVNVTDGGSAPAAFQLDCPPGRLTVTANTQGNNGGQGTYRVVVDGTQTKSIAAHGGTASFPSVSTGSHMLQLINVPPNCTVVGQNPRTVTVPASINMDVVCGGGGGAITYAHGFDLWQMNPDGTNPSRTYASGGTPQEFAKWPSWSPDGSQIVFSRGYWGGLWTINAGDSVPTPLTQPGYSVWPDWATPNLIAFSRQLPQTNPGFTWIYTIDPTTGATAQITQSDIRFANQPNVSPDGSNIVFSGFPEGTQPGRAVDIYQVPATGGTSVKLTNNPPEIDAWGPSYSPDGASIAYAEGVYSTPNRGVGNLVSVSIKIISGGAVRTLVSGLAGWSQNVKITWSPDGTKLLYNAGDQINGVGPTWVYLINADGTGLKQLGPGHDPDWLH